MEWDRTVGLLLVGAAFTYAALWGEGMWEPGSWQWGVVAAWFLASGVFLLVKPFWFPKGLIVTVFAADPEQVRRVSKKLIGWALVAALAPPTIIGSLKVLSVVWATILCFVGIDAFHETNPC